MLCLDVCTSIDDWASVRNLRDFLKHFYEIILFIFGTSYVTIMTIKMKEKCDKYWGDIDKMNLLMFVACV
ncbi:hypothetical protein Goshw_020015 [Gossypium schwendimanii]|uniref:hAT-like transposase RNase-H fold domain-containing protein n=1 Tax=Gossypium schwendimanii TaxID=34291 RepID=A0A7J9KYA6_GOSSC|nr:hypothetical protein [Gossypium schwendimanii]